MSSLQLDLDLEMDLLLSKSHTSGISLNFKKLFHASKHVTNKIIGLLSGRIDSFEQNCSTFVA